MDFPVVKMRFNWRLH